MQAMKSTAKTLTLKEMRELKGLSQAEVANQLARRLNEPSRTTVSILQIEKRGTEKYSVIVALAAIFDQPVDAVVAASCSKK